MPRNDTSASNAVSPARLQAGARPEAAVVSPQVAEGPPYFPEELSAAYGLPTKASSTQTVALVDAYNDLTAEKDLETFDNFFNLPPCKKAEGCFRQVGQTEHAPLPYPESEAKLKKDYEEPKGSAARIRAEEAIGWTTEISLDIETVRAICHNCHILLVEANSGHGEDLEEAERTAEHLGANEISNSWGMLESGVTGDSAFNDPGVVITAAAGDTGYRNWYGVKEGPFGEVPYTSFPASSPHVIAVGGTRLQVNKSSGAWESESVWNGSGAGGGGCSEVFTAPTWQQELTDWGSVGCERKRAVSDISADADPYTGVPVRDTGKPGKCESTGWCQVGGTSLASPLIASVFALAGGSSSVSYPAKTLYENVAKHHAALHDIEKGSNGTCAKGFEKETGLSLCTEAEEAETSCKSKFICLACEGYDGPTGLGTPAGIGAFTLGFAGGEEGSGEPEGSCAPKASASSNASSNNSGSSEPSKSGSSPPSNTIATPTATPPTLRISSLALTFKATLALKRSHPKASLLAFKFTISAAARVRVTLARRARRHGHTVWITQPDSRTITATAGRNSTSLTGRNTLAAGSYRLTLTPVVRTPVIAPPRWLNFQTG